jgi:hypothetical protein
MTMHAYQKLLARSMGMLTTYLGVRNIEYDEVSLRIKGQRTPEFSNGKVAAKIQNFGQPMQRNAANLGGHLTLNTRRRNIGWLWGTRADRRVPNDLGGIPGNDRMGWDISGDDRPRFDQRTTEDMHLARNGGGRHDRCTSFQDNPGVVSAGVQNRAGTNTAVIADLAVSPDH